MDKELLFILIIIITVVINIAKAIKKKNQPAVSDPETAENEDKQDWQEVLREMLGDKARTTGPEPQMHGEYETLETLEPLGKTIEDMKDYTFREPEYTKSSFRMEAFDVSQSTSQDDMINTSFTNERSFLSHRYSFLKEFDLKQAVIYNSILNRPYD